MIMEKAVLINEWDNDKFHERVMKLEAEGFTARLDTYRIIPEMDPDTGKIIHLYIIEMYKAEQSAAR
jgi:hypothetical protein